MLEKVNKFHPDKIADRIAGAIVDYAYTLDDNPRIAVEVLIGHSSASIIAETSVNLNREKVIGIMRRIALPASLTVLNFHAVPQDAHLSQNQQNGFRCGDNGVFTAKWSIDYEKATHLAKSVERAFPFDGKYLFDFQKNEATICQSNAHDEDIRNFFNSTGLALAVNPLGYWTGGINTDTGCTNRKLGSDQPFCNPNGLHGKDLSKADVSVSIYINELSRKLDGAFVKAYCSIGDETVTIITDENEPEAVSFAGIVEFARNYIQMLGGFEVFAEHGVR